MYRLQGKRHAAAMIDDADDRNNAAVGTALAGEVEAPGSDDGLRGGYISLVVTAKLRDFIAVNAYHFGDPCLADGDLALGCI